VIYIILSDIHGNLEALEAVVESLGDIRGKKILCLGDIVGYGADPVDCLRIVRSMGAESVVGNHDAGVIEKTDISVFNENARAAVYWTMGILSDGDKDYLGGLPYLAHHEFFSACHGTLHDPERFHYMLGGADAMHTFEILERRVCFVGHSHKAGVFSLRQGKVFSVCKDSLVMEEGVKYIVNAGSVGQPRDADNRACYCVYDTDEGKIEFRRVDYDMKKAGKKIMKAGLPPMLAERLKWGR